MKKTKYLILTLMLLWGTTSMAQSEFKTNWALPSGSTSPVSSISFNALTTGAVNYSWTTTGGTSGSGSFNNSSAGNQSIAVTLNAGEVLTLSMEPANLKRFFMGGLASVTTSNLLLVDVLQWGDVNWSSMAYAFANCQNLTLTVPFGDVPNLTNLTDMTSMFYQCYKMTGSSNMNNWNVSNVTNMSFMFHKAYLFNRNIGGWNVSNVTNMSSMFSAADAFNQDISGWDVSSVTDMSYMFFGTDDFNQPIGTGNWNVGNVEKMEYMFTSAGTFNQPLTNWQTNSLQSMDHMFSSTGMFDQPLNHFDVDQVTDFSGVFRQAQNFDRPLNNWIVSNAINMSEMFYLTKKFNQPLEQWNTANVENMYYMFAFAEVFNQDLSGFELNSVTNIQGMLSFSDLDCVNYGKTLKGWAETATTPTGLTLGASGLKYGPPAASYHNTLTSTKGWTINDAGEDAVCTQALPVGFGNITATIKNGQLQINWTTLTESNSSHFEIEASTDGSDFTKIGTVKSKAENGDSAIALSYSFTKSDSAVLFGVSILALALALGFKQRRKMSYILAIAGIITVGFGACSKKNEPLAVDNNATIFIRIKQIDKDGAFKYSKTVKAIVN